MRNASVLPEPVRAAPRISFPVSPTGIDSSCMGVIVANPIPLSACRVCSDKFTLENSFWPETLGSATGVGAVTSSEAMARCTEVECVD